MMSEDRLLSASAAGLSPDRHDPVAIDRRFLWSRSELWADMWRI